MQFYYNGMNIISYKGYDIMDNGSDLDCCLNKQWYLCASSARNGSMILPSVLDSNRYFVFQTNIDTSVIQQAEEITMCSKLLLHTVDMSYNNGEGKVIERNEVVFRSKYLLTRLA